MGFNQSQVRVCRRKITLERPLINEGLCLGRITINNSTVFVFQHSDLCRVMKDENGTIIDGDPAEAETFVDQWTFERDVGSANPNWLLVETQTSES